MAREHRRADLIEAELLEWSDAPAEREQTLAEQEAALADAVAAFERDVSDFAGRFTERRSPRRWWRCCGDGQGRLPDGARHRGVGAAEAGRHGSLAQVQE